jgi:hypothetical protein
MDNKRNKPREDANKAAHADGRAKQKTSRKPLRRVAEGPENLRQRAEWFDRRRRAIDK